MRQDIEFDAEGTTLRGWLYVPDNASGPAPAIVMCHGYSAVKELFLDAFAEVFCEAGFCALVYDNRNLGASDGEPRQEIDPWAQVRDYRHAITFARTLDEVDSDRIGIWGSSYSGAHALVVGAIDRRVKCVVAQVPLISGHENARRLVRADLIKPTQDMFDADREARYRGDAPMMIPVVAPEGEPCALPTADSYEWFTTSGSDRAPSWINECTLRSVEMFWEYEPGTYLPWISPTPLLMVVARGDHLTVSDLAIDAFERAREPKKLELLSGGHFDAYIADFERSSGAARDWFVQHLTTGAREPALH
jgi:fermentation-respiration switch protein FrsA (DUF1100 family)